MLQIPALEWDEKTITGTSSVGSPTISSVPDTTSIFQGQVIDDASFSYPTLVVSKTSNSITLNKNATANKTGSFSFFNRFEFQYPAKRDQGEQLRANQTRTLSLSGVQQTITNYIDARRTLTFSFLTQTENTTLRDSFYTQWALLGKSFRYYNDKAINSKVVYFNNNEEYRQERIVKKHPDYLYEVDFSFRRVV